ncbi:MAG TPA: TraR/DksA C4-type zinc finger protein [Gaiellaceae bacterium]|jgi:RNA polymerase-binding transcription factor|nr:TraR/DksA C4-type zinc finger protein [Gaiellaceae bacterium]
MSGELDLERFRSVLESERDRLLHARQAVHHDGSLLEETGDLAIGSGDHIADSATETYLRELDEGLEENADHVLVAIDEALGRIEDGTYGLCSACGGPIGEERLEAVPYATLCIEDKRALERSI